MATQAYDFQPVAGFLEPVHRQDLTDHLLELETTLFDPGIRRDTGTVADLLTDDFREFGTTGRVYTKLDILAELSTEEPAMITLNDFTCEQLAPTVALVTYKSLATFDMRAGSQALRTSVWVLRAPEVRYGQIGPREGRWQMQFHQGTRF